jgi:membrane dipeptidase
MREEASNTANGITVSQASEKLHRQAVVVDGHIDTLLEIVNGKVSGIGERNSLIHVDLPRLKEGGVGVQFFAAFIEPAYKPERALKRTLQLISRFHREIQMNQDQIALALSYKDIETILAKNKIAAILSIEGGEGISGDLGILHTFYLLGVRAIGLTWNERNDIAEGVGEKHANGGLTTFGRQVVTEMNRLGMLVDVSHLTERGFWDVIEVSQKPIIASHSNAYEQCAHVRNLRDDQIKALAANGGVMGMNFAPPFIDAEHADIARLVDHIDHIVTLVGPDHVGLGSDFDGIPSTPQGLEDVSTLPRITQALLDRGYSDADVLKVLGGNFMRVLESAL